MKRFLLILPTLVIGFVAALAPVSLSTAHSPSLQSNTALAVTQNVFCKDAYNGYTDQTTAEFCANHGGAYDTSKGTYPYLCADGNVHTGKTGAEACKDVGGVSAVGQSDTVSSPDCIKLSIPIFAHKTYAGCQEGEIPNNLPGGAIVFYLKLILQMLSGLIGAVILLMLIIAGIQYITSAGQPDQIKKAKDRIMNSVIALILFLMAFAIINFLIPNGVFS